MVVSRGMVGGLGVRRRRYPSRRCPARASSCVRVRMRARVCAYACAPVCVCVRAFPYRRRRLTQSPPPLPRHPPPRPVRSSSDTAAPYPTPPTEDSRPLGARASTASVCLCVRAVCGRILCVRACVRVTHRRGPVCPYRAEYAAVTYFHHHRDRTLSPRYALLL